MVHSGPLLGTNPPVADSHPTLLASQLHGSYWGITGDLALASEQSISLALASCTAKKKKMKPRLCCCKGQRRHLVSVAEDINLRRFDSKLPSLLSEVSLITNLSSLLLQGLMGDNLFSIMRAAHVEKSAEKQADRDSVYSAVREMSKIYHQSQRGPEMSSLQ